MHFAIPPKKSSHKSHYTPRSSRIPSFRRSRLKHFVLLGLGIGAVILILLRIFRSSRQGLLVSGAPPVVIVTVLDTAPYGSDYIENLKENRIEYAKRHGYETFFPENGEYNLNGAPRSWAKVPAMRHAMTKWPHTTYFWFLDQNALIMNPELTVESIMDAKRMDRLMIKDQAIVPPDSVIKTFSHIKGYQIEFALTQDKVGLAPDSYILKQGDWAKFFLDTWFDPLYRSYNFQKAETHALEHLVQWHPTILAKLALIPQKVLNSYSQGDEDLTSTYTKGDFIVRFNGCEPGGDKDCETEAEPYLKTWRKIFNVER